MLMPEKIDELKEEVWTHFKDFQYVFLATAEGNQPKVRPVTLIYFDKRFWITTDTGSAKIKQIQGNPNIEFCLYLQKDSKEGYVRVSGMAKIIKDRKTKVKVADHCDFFTRHWKSVDDPNYTLIEICSKEIGYIRLGEFQAQRFKI